MKMWKCSVCGYIHTGDDAPDFCPKCDSPKEKFTELTAEQAEKIATAERTNDIHMKLINIAAKIDELCEEGILLNLDPPCVSTFERAKAEARVIKQRAKAELEGHMNRGKW